MNALEFALGWTLLHFLWQGALIGAISALLLGLMRKAHATQRYMVGCAAQLACLAWPVSGLVQDWQAASNVSATVAAGMAAAVITNKHLLIGIDAQLPLLVGAWLLCALALTVRSAFGLGWIACARRTGRVDTALQQRLSQLAASLGIKRIVELRIVDALASPITAGWLRPVVLVPASLVTGMPPALLDALLAHELAHVRRYDYLVNLVQNTIEILLFYHPVVWWLSRRIRHERELIADAMAANATGEPQRLAKALSELEKLQFAAPRMALGAADGDLLARIRHLVLPPQQQVSAWKSLLPALCVTAVFLTAYAQARTDVPDASSERRPAIVDFSSCSKPLWPKADLRAEHTGTVTLEFMIAASGEVRGSRVVRSSGHAGLDKAAQIGISKCHFKPARVRGVPVATAQKMQYVWMLQ
jgi:D-alanyl-D-alanine endopeptidase (penicillin-binding protein 7)